MKHHCNSKLLFPRRRTDFRWSVAVPNAVVVCRRVMLVALCLIISVPNADAQPPTREQEAVREPAQSPPLSKSASHPSNTEKKKDALTPDFFIASVALEAEVVGDRVMIDAAIEIVVNQESESGWHRVPLRFDQAHIRAREYAGPGEEAPDFYSRNGEDGIFWMLKGKGKHLLNFSMWVPVRQSVIGSQFALSLPPLPNQFSTQFNLTIPEPDARLRPAPNLVIHKTEHARSKTTFETSLERKKLERIRLDIAWTVPLNTSRKVSKVTTKFHLKPASDSLLLVADQSIDLQQQNLRELFIRLPSDFELVDQKGERIQTTELVVDRPGWIRVQLTAGTGLVELHWVFRKATSKEGERLTIDGLEVEGAILQGGSVRIDDLSGYRILPQIANSRMIYRVNRDDMQAGSNESLNSFYEFLQQPFRLVHEIRPIEPLHSVTPIYEIIIRSDFMELAVHQLVEVERGELSSLSFAWPKFEEKDWKLINSEAASLTFGEIQTSKNESSDDFVLSLPDPISNGERVHLITRFRRPLTLDQRTQINWTLPVISKRYVRGELIVIDLDDDLELLFHESSNANLTPMTNENHTAQLVAQWGLEHLRTLMQSTSAKIVNASSTRNLSATVTRHERKTTATTTIEIQEATPRDLLIKQQLDFEIQYGRMESIDFNLPDDLMKFIQLSEFAESVDVQFQGERLPVKIIGGVPKAIFPEPIIGKNSIEVQYRFPTHVGLDQQRIDLPVISVTEVPFDQVKCLVTPIENVRVEQSDSGWVAILTSPQGALWLKRMEESPIHSIPLTIGGALADASQQYIVERANLWTRFDADGGSDSLARFEILSPPSRVLMSFAPGTVLKQVFADGKKLDVNAISRSVSSDGQVIIPMPDHIRERRILEFEYSNESDSIFTLAKQHSFHFPEFSESVWVDEMVWEFQLPTGQHLFGYPKLKPLFQWKRNGVVWERQPNGEYLSERNADWKSINEKFHFNENFYAFRGFSPIQEVTFRSMNRSLILLVGAGFALGMGFVFYRFPVTRNVFSLFVMAFAFAVASLWFLEPMLLLLQPAIIGMLLALIATVIDVRTRKNFFDRSTLLRRPPQGDSHVVGEPEPTDGTTRVYSPTGSSVSNLSRE